MLGLGCIGMYFCKSFFSIKKFSFLKSSVYHTYIGDGVLRI
jgi:hypothetical protein